MSGFKDRVKFLDDVDLDPQSLVGSYFNVLEDEEPLWQGLVVAEPQPGIYLVHIDQLRNGVTDVQKLVPLIEMAQGEYEWLFYDSKDDARVAYMVLSRDKEEA